MSSEYRDYVVTAREMKLLEMECIEQQGIASIALMERAAKAAKKVLLDRYSQARVFYVCCGTGGNAGDGFALARLLLSDGYKVKVFIFNEVDSYDGDPRRNLDALIDLGLEPIYIKKSSQIDYYDIPDVYIDALFGIGLSREIVGVYTKVISYLNSSSVPIFSLDIASGLDATTGDIQGVCIKADCTVTFAYAKRGHYLKNGRKYTGQLYIEPIWHENLDKLSDINTYMLNNNAIGALIEKRELDMHKASFGRIGVIAGSLGMVGAAVHSAKAAYECGCGLVTLFADKDVANIAQTLAPNIIVYINEHGPDTFNENVQAKLDEFLKDKDVVILGPGLSTSEYSRKLCSYVQKAFKKPMIVDADALNALAINDITEGSNCILTPHPGEASRILECSTEEVLSEPIESARNISNSTKAVTVLKGNTSIILSAEGITYLNIAGNPALAKGGSGDVLSGIIAAFAARGIAKEKAAALGCFVLGLCAERYTENKSENSLSPEKIIDQLEYILP